MVALEPHQQKAVDELGNGKILCGGVGSGKTHTALAYYFTKVCGGVINEPNSMRTPKDLVIITTAKKRNTRDWQRTAVSFGIGEDYEGPHPVNIEVESWNNITKFKDRTGCFFIFDEQKVVGSGAWAQQFIKLAQVNDWILLSATPGDTWLDYVPVFVANGFYKNRTAFKRDHTVYSNYGRYPKLERYLGEQKLQRLRAQVLVEMPVERHTVRHTRVVPCEYDREAYKKVVKDRWHVYEERPITDAAEMVSVMRRVVNSDESRITTLTDLLGKHPRLIVFYNFDYELEKLRSLGEDLSKPSSGTSPNGSSDTQNPRPSTTSSEPSTSPTWETGSRSTSCSLSTQEPSETRSDSSPVGSPTESATTPPEPPSTPRPSESFPTSRSFLESGTSSSRVRSEISAISATAQSVGGENHTPTIAEWNGHKHEEIPETDSWVYLVQYTAGAEAWECTTTDAMVFYSLNYSYKVTEQCRGRIDRLNTPFTDLNYYVLKSAAPIDSAITRALKHKQTFNERAFVGKSWQN